MVKLGKNPIRFGKRLGVRNPRVGKTGIARFRLKNAGGKYNVGSFKRVVDLGNINSTTGAQNFFWEFAMDNVYMTLNNARDTVTVTPTGFTDITDNFKQYKITRIKMQFFPHSNFNTSTGTTSMGLIFSSLQPMDIDDYQETEAEMEQDGTIKPHYWAKPFHRSFKPMIFKPIVKEYVPGSPATVTYGYISEPSPFLDSESCVDVRHEAFCLAMNATASANNSNWRVVCTYYISAQYAK